MSFKFNINIVWYSVNEIYQNGFMKMGSCIINSLEAMCILSFGVECIYYSQLCHSMDANTYAHTVSYIYITLYWMTNRLCGWPVEHIAWFEHKLQPYHIHYIITVGFVSGGRACDTCLGKNISHIPKSHFIYYLCRTMLF